MKEGLTTPIQPPGLMNLRLMHRQEHHQRHQACLRTIHDVVSHPKMSRSHIMMNSYMVLCTFDYRQRHTMFLAGLNRAGYRPCTHCMAWHSSIRCRYGHVKLFALVTMRQLQ